MTWRHRCLLVCSRCRNCCYYCGLCTLSLAVIVTVVFVLGVHRWLLAQAGLAYGDEMEAGIPLETQGQLHILQAD